jgi:DNA replication protein DnaC
MVGYHRNTLLSERYERGSVMITSNFAFSQWERIFKDPVTTAAAIDCLIHHRIILELNIDSYRREHSRNHGQKKGKTTKRTKEQSEEVIVVGK